MSDNPFNPGFGVSPLYLAGRDSNIAAIRNVALNLSRADYGRTVVVSGQRGIGKTVLLNHAEDLAKQAGWVVVSETATTGFVDRIIKNGLLPMVPERSRGGVSASIGVTVPPVTASIGVSSPQPERATPVGLRPALASLVQAHPNRGVLFTLDELGNRAVREMEDFVTSYQHFIREGYPVGLVIGGIPAMLSRLLSRKNSATTFLNRASKSALNLLPYEVALSAFRNTIALRGTRTVSERALEAMTGASMGYPFLIQEIGKLAWDERPDAAEISVEDVEAVIPQARETFADSVLSVIVASLSDRARQLLTVIADSPGIHTKELGEAMGIPMHSVPSIKQHLLAAGVVEPDGRGIVRIAVPYLQNYIRAQSGAPKPSVPNNLSILDSYNKR